MRSLIEIGQSLINPDKEILVPSGFRSARAPNTLFSCGIVPCIAVGAISKDRGFLSHDAPLLTGTMYLDRLLKAIKTLEEVKLYIVGNSTSMSNPVLMIKQEKAKYETLFLDRIINTGYENAIKEVMWGYGTAFFLRLNLSKGKAEITWN